MAKFESEIKCSLDWLEGLWASSQLMNANTKEQRESAYAHRLCIATTLNIVERQMPKPIIPIDTDWCEGVLGKCPSCLETVPLQTMFCGRCGQAIDNEEDIQ